MSFSYQGHYRYKDLAGELENSITDTLGYNMMEMQARSQEALQAMLQQHEQQQQPPPDPPPPKVNRKERDEQKAQYKRAQTNAQKAHNERIAQRNKQRVEAAMARDGVAAPKQQAAKKVKAKPSDEIPDAQLKDWKQ